MRSFPVAAIAVAVGAALAPAAASAHGNFCGNAGSGQAGLGVTNVIAHQLSCPAARYVARRTRARSHAYTLSPVLGVNWRCRITQDATGSDPGSVLATKVTCVSPRGAELHYHLRS
jgi:hypothetical protein